MYNVLVNVFSLCTITATLGKKLVALNVIFEMVKVQAENCISFRSGNGSSTPRMYIFFFFGYIKEKP